jgi:hypothetical protein
MEIDRAATIAANEALAAEAKNAAQVEAELRATESVLQCAEIDRAIELMLEANDNVVVVQTAATLLAKLLANVISQPDNDKFRQLKKDNKHIASKVLVARGAISLLRAVGFQPVVGDKNLLRLPPAADPAEDEKDRLEYALLAVGGLGDKKIAQLAKKNAAEREARLAEVRREAAGRRAAVNQLRSQAEIDKAARRDPTWEARGFEKSGRDVGRLPSG